MQLTKYPKSSTNKFGCIMCTPNGFDATKTYPLIVFLAGQGAVGDGSYSALDIYANGELPIQLQQAIDKYNFILISPQTGSSYVSGEVDFALAFAKGTYHIDSSKMYLTGLSLGAGGTWWYVDQSPSNASKFAAVAPIATTWQTGNTSSIVQSGLPVWAFHNSNDTNGATPAAATESLVNSINAASPKIQAAMTIFNATGHGGWTSAYDPTTIPIPPGSQGLINPGYNLYQWLLANSIGNGVAVGSPLPTQPPVTPPVDTIIRSYQTDEYSSGKVVAKRLI